jgi:hypothetical protein
MWTRYAGPEGAWPKALSLPFLISSYVAASRKRESSKQISQAITYDMALSVSHCLDSQIPVSGGAWRGWSRRGRGYPSDLWFRRLRSVGNECIECPFAPYRHASAQVGPLGSHGTGEGTDSDQNVKQFRNLGKSPNELINSGSGPLKLST